MQPLQMKALNCKLKQLRKASFIICPFFLHSLAASLNNHDPKQATWLDAALSTRWAFVRFSSHSSPPLPSFNVHLQFEFEGFLLAWHQPVFGDRCIATDTSERGNSLFVLTYMSCSCFCVSESIACSNQNDESCHVISNKVKISSFPSDPLDLQRLYFTSSGCSDPNWTLLVLLVKPGIKPTNSTHPLC